MNLKGYFNALDCAKYQVRIVADSGSNSYQVVQLEGNSPFVTNYNVLNRLFEPIMISTASITIVHDDYINDVYSPYAQGTKIYLEDITENENNPELVWFGYLKPQIYSQGYSKCYEDIELNASDTIASLKYIDYETIGSHKQIVTFKDILDRICDVAGEEIKGYYWPRTKKIGQEVLLPNMLKISECNFYSSDTDEPIKYYEVLEEICLYLGLTCVQWKDMFVFMDHQAFHSIEQLPVHTYLKSNNYAYNSTYISLGSTKVVDKDTYRGGSNNISFEPIYNKATVRDNIYYVEDFIPDIFEKDNLTNRLGGTKAEEVPLVQNTIEVSERGFDGDTGYTPIFYNSKGDRKHDAPDNDYAYYRKIYDHDKYESVYRTKSLVETTPSSNELITTGCTRNYVGGTLVDFAAINKGDSNAASYEIASTASFTKYILIHQWDAIELVSLLGPTSQAYYADKFPSVFRLKPGFYNPIITDGDNTYLAFFCEAKFERYEDRDYFNPDWTDEPSKGGNTNHNQRPYYNAKLAIGNMYYGTYGWTSADTTFFAMGRSEEDEKRPQFMDSANWNKERETLNNIPFTDWTGADGFKIPLSPDIDLNGEIKFEFNFPPVLASMWWSNPSKEKPYSGQNHWCWVSDLSLKIFNKMGEEFVKQDVVYGGKDNGVIDEKSINEMDEITFKITTWPGKGNLAYSVVGNANTGVYLSAITETYMSNVPRKPEENLVEKLIEQYSTQTIKEDIEVDLGFAPYNKIYDEYWDNKKFVWAGSEIDYKAGKQKMNIIEKK